MNTIIFILVHYNQLITYTQRLTVNVFLSNSNYTLVTQEIQTQSMRYKKHVHKIASKKEYYINFNTMNYHTKTNKSSLCVFFSLYTRIIFISANALCVVTWICNLFILPSLLYIGNEKIRWRVELEYQNAVVSLHNGLQNGRQNGTIVHSLAHKIRAMEGIFDLVQCNILLT